MFANTNVLITGCQGFVGTAIAKDLMAKGAHVIALVKDQNRKSFLKAGGNLSVVYGDIRDREVIRYCLSKYEAHYVIHLAAQPIVRICHNDPYTAYMTNAIGTLNVVEEIRNLVKKPLKVVCISSDKAYGPAPVPYTEDTPYAVFDSYCTSKLCADAIGLSYARTYDLPIVMVRAGNIYGPGDLNTSRLIPRSILRMLDGLSPVLYSGVADYCREFIYIGNIVNAFSTLLEKGVPGEAYNIGGTEPQRILDVITSLRDKINPEIEIDIVEKEFDEIETQYLSADKLMALGWKPEVSLDEGLDNTIEWCRGYRESRGW